VAAARNTKTIGGTRGSRLRIALVAAAAFAALGVADQVAASDGELRRPPTWSDRGLSDDLGRTSGTHRVRISTRAQPLLAAALTADISSFPSAAADRDLRAIGRGHPGRITSVERESARRAERWFERSVRALGPEAARASSLIRRLESLVEASGGSVVASELVPAAVVARVPSHDLGDLARRRLVGSIEAAPRDRPLSGVGTQAVGAPSWWTAGFTGGGGFADVVPADAALRSEAVDPTHPAFDDVTVENDPTLPPSDHGTHTGGVVASGDSTYPGVAPGIDQLIGAGDEAYALGFETETGPGASDAAESLNYSFGSPATSDDEDDTDDVLTHVFGVGQALAAGNENVDGSATVGNIGHNTLSVGAFNDVGTITSTDDVVLGVSSRGPTPVGRKKPDLTAPGGAVIAPSMFWNSPPSNPDFTGMSGTSFAAPHVTGALTLLEGAGIGDPMAQRAILINSARDWNGKSTGLAGWAPPQASWRPEVGWGELDLTTTLAHRGDYALGEVKGGEAAYFSATVPTGAKATLAYEMRGYFVGFPNPGTQTFRYTQSDLDLHQYEGGSEVAPSADPGHGGGPDAVDPDDTVEQVRAPAGPQEIVYKVEAVTDVVGAEAEPFAIASSAPLTALDAPVVRPVSLAASAHRAPCGQDVVISAALDNESDDLGSDGTELELEIPDGTSLISGATTQVVSGGGLDPGEVSEVHQWTVKADSEGMKTFVVTGSGAGLGTGFTRSVEIDVEADCTPPSTTIDSGPPSLTNDSTPTFSFSGAADGGYECSIDGGAFSGCDSPLTVGPLADGDRAFSVVAVDAVGNVDPTPASRAFTVDTVVAGPRVEVASRRPDRRKAKLGKVKLSLAEAGGVAVAGSAKVRGKRISLVASDRQLDGDGTVIPLRARKQDRRKVRMALTARRPIKVTVRTTFSDLAGNEARRQATFTVRTDSPR